MLVDTKSVQGRRKLHFRSFDDVIGDAEQLVAAPHVRMRGNWPLPQLLMHLAHTINVSIDGVSARAPLPARIWGMFAKRRVLREGLPLGVQLPKEREALAFPTAPSAEDALHAYRKAVARLRTERMAARQPVFGKLTHEEWTQLHLRHAELHLSFAVPSDFNASNGMERADVRA